MWESLKSEFHKITWISRKNAIKKSSIVVVASIVLGVIISMIDFISKFGVDKIVELLS